MANNVDYNDPNHYSGNDLTLEQALNGIENKMYGKDVRYAIIQMARRIAEKIDGYDENSTSIDKDLQELENRINRIVMGTDEETIRVVVDKILDEKGLA